MTDFIQDTDAFTAGGTSIPGLKFPDLGHAETGIVTKVDERDDTDPNGVVKKWDNGQPKKVFIFTVLQADGEERALWVRGNMVKAIREAVTEAGVKTVIGCTLTVQHHALGDKPKPGFNAAKLFRAKLEPPKATAATTPW